MRKISGYFKNNGFILLLICILAMAIRLSFFAALKPWDEGISQEKVIIGDAAGYHNSALSIVATRSLADIGTSKGPAYPVIIAFVYFLFGVKPWIILLLQVFLDTAIVVIVYLMAKMIFRSPQVPLIAAFLYSMSFPSAYYCIRLLTDIPFVFFLSACILFFLRALNGNKARNLVFAALFAGIATLIRPIGQYLPLVFVVTLLFDKVGPIQKLRKILILLVIFSVVIGAWQVRNLRRYGYYDLATIGSSNLCSYYAAITKATAENIGREEARDSLIGDSLNGVTNPFEKARILRKIGLSYISRHPLQYIKCQLKGTLNMFLGTSRRGILDLFGIKATPPLITESVSVTAHRIIKNFRHELPTSIIFIKQVFEYIFIVIGLFIMLGKEKKIFTFFLLATILYFIALTGPVGYSRFRTPIIPLYVIISAAGIFAAFKSAAAKKRSRRSVP